MAHIGDKKLRWLAQGSDLLCGENAPRKCRTLIM